MTDPEEAALLRAIGAAPGEFTARLAYADWLDEHGRGLEAAWVRDEGTAPPRVTELGGSGHGEGKGNGDGQSDGCDYSDDDDRHGDDGSHGDGYGYGYGGRSYSHGVYGHGYSSGRGDGHGYGSGLGGRGIGVGEGDGGRAGRIATRKLQHLIPHEEVPMPVSGAYVIVRSRDQGCVCGEYRGHHGREVVLGKARQIFSWEGGRLTLFDFAVVPGACRLSREAPGEVVMLEACGIIPTTAAVEAFLRAHPGE
ncbi:hypothetical protein GobsT_11860 [Gemmata obscuriglobus]|uniref:TIGR02996 domain-containing protein n=1 Tax=Gemmata obscuriglobus TaxID=114 RepID=A0A2Z3H3J4_9BACT|nr:TIGR02996 domain-containing protein [Gemmata obscuriglobus]AWM40338.1 TIGR02996 domain-containing protein [Gemmata obscuriglobus]QEG26447.1 hypothetical protein GobsT_11860 [Gemmata obscuriglobus]VTS01629.1 unnamed protein product [Gemmata obscuriglobus UQM 2246]